MHTLSFFTVLNAQEALVVQTSTRIGRRASDSHTEFTTALSVGSDGSVATAAWLSTFELSSVGDSIESDVVCEGARDGGDDEGTHEEPVDAVDVVNGCLDFDFGFATKVSATPALIPHLEELRRADG